MLKQVLTFTILAAVLVIAVAFYFKRNERSASFSSEPVSRGMTFDTWPDYLESGMEKDASPRKVVFIGIDGACWNIIDPLIEEGLLPTFAMLKREGAHGILRSVECYVSPPAWTTMMTGYLPEHTGIFTFGMWDRERREFLNITAQDVKVPSLWDAASFVGRRVAVANVPVTYPVREVDGIMVSGLLTPASLDERKVQRVRFRALPDTEKNRAASFSPVLYAVLRLAATEAKVFLVDKTNDGQRNYDAVSVQTGMTRSNFPLAQYSDWIQIDHEANGKRQKAWSKVLVFPTNQPDVFGVATSRVFFDVGDTEVAFTHPEALQTTLKNTFDHYLPSKFLDRSVVPSFTDEHIRYANFLRQLDDWDAFFYVFTQTDNVQHLDGVSPITKHVYRTLDQYLADLVATLPDDAVLIVASDHGFKEYRYVIDLNKLFEQMGLLAYKNDTEIDHDKTLVFHNLWNLYFNEKLLTEEELARRSIDILPSQTPREALTTFLERGKPSFRIPEGNQLITVELFPYPRSTFDATPDMIVKGTYSNYMVEFWNLKRPAETVIRPLQADQKWNHTREGMYLFYGKGVRRGYTGPVENIQDMAPTILHLLDVPLSSNMDGRVIDSVFDSRAFARRTFPVINSYSQIYAEATSEEEREALEEKLRSLGYIR